mmetsp:Transcript_33966/g.55120  ORF Transcript_33966/g.55120 Transcript_33966/m.55120 type:complete len:268 (-) Transcript_33966:200-1003(-)
MVLTLAYSFRNKTNLQPPPKMVLLVNDKVEESTLDLIKETKLWDHIIPISENEKGLNTSSTFFFKFNAFKLGGICDRVLWMGADSVVLKSIDELFKSPFVPAAAPDLHIWARQGLHVSFNGDFVLFKPSENAHRRLIHWVNGNPSPMPKHRHGPHDQGALNDVFDDQVHVLPWYYSVLIPKVMDEGLNIQNITTSVHSTEWRQMLEKQDMWKTLHMASFLKPWMVPKTHTLTWKFLQKFSNVCGNMMTEHPMIAKQLCKQQTCNWCG